MNKFTKISLVALFSIFLSACDKPADNTQAKAETAKTAQVQAVDDLNKILAWKTSQETALNEAQNELQQGIASQDKTKIEEGFKAVQAKVNEVLKSLEELNIKNPDVLAFKEKTKESLVSSNELIAIWVKAASEPTPENQNLVQEKAQKLIELGAELQKMQFELQKKFAPTTSN